jgi:hypothetical protein
MDGVWCEELREKEVEEDEEDEDKTCSVREANGIDDYVGMTCLF